MSFKDVAKAAKKAFDKKYREHNRLTKEIEYLYRLVLPRIPQPQRDRLNALHKEAQAKINETKTKLEKEMTEKFTTEVDAIELDYMKKELNMLQLWKNSIDGGDILIQSKFK